MRNKKEENLEIIIYQRNCFDLMIPCLVMFLCIETSFNPEQQSDILDFYEFIFYHLLAPVCNK